MSLLNRFFGSLRPNPLERDIDDEHKYHIELAARELQSEGLSAEEAHRQAQLRFGNACLAREDTRRQDLIPWLDDTFRDLRIAIRGLRRSPSYSLIVFLTLALGIGANSAIFSLVYGVLFRPLPYSDSDRLTFLSTQLANGRRTAPNYEDIQDWRRDSKAFSDIAGVVARALI